MDNEKNKIIILSAILFTAIIIVTIGSVCYNNTHKDVKSNDTIDTSSKTSNYAEQNNSLDINKVDNEQKTVSNMSEQKSEQNIEINSSIYNFYGLSYDEVIKIKGTPNFDSGAGDWLGRQLIYDDYFIMLSPQNKKVYFVSGDLDKMLTVENNENYKIQDVLKKLGISENAEYLVGRGQGDFDHLEGVCYIRASLGDYIIEITYDNNTNYIVKEKSVNLYSDIFNYTEYMENSKSEPNVQSSQDDLSATQIEDEVLRIRNIYNDIVKASTSGSYKLSNLTNNIKAYYDNSGNVRQIVLKENGEYPSRSYYYENDKLIFAYIEGKDSHRLYFYNENLFRWRYSADSAKASEAKNYDNANTDEFNYWENFALNEAATLKNSAYSN